MVDQSANFQSNQESGEVCERISHLVKNDLYYAHLSIYYFASRYCQGGLVMDAGSGSGYGAAYLADKGSRFVWGCELDKEAIASSKEFFQRENLEYRVMDLQNITGFPLQSLDLILSSNVLEHIPDVSVFFRNACRLLKPDGCLIIAVPPITRDIDWNENIANVYHLNIWTPLQWEYILKQYMDEVQPYSHGFAKKNIHLDFYNKPGETVISETDFIFNSNSVGDFFESPSLTAIFVAKSPRPEEEFPKENSPISFVDSSFTRNDSLKVEYRASPPYYMLELVPTTYTNLGPLVKGQRICQKFVARENRLSALLLLVATYCSQIDSIANLCIYDESMTKILRSTRMSTSSFLDNTWQQFEFVPIHDSQGKIFWFCIETDAQEQAITLWTNQSISGVCQKNGEHLNEAVCFQTRYLPISG